MFDSTNQNSALSTFRVTAQNFETDLICRSEQFSGYSVDNIAPSVPNGLTITLVDSSLKLEWNKVSDLDFQFYIVERDHFVQFTNPQTFEMENSYFLVSDYNSEEDYFYRVYSVDHAGNISDHSTIMDATALSNQNLAFPQKYSLEQNYPNPFNPFTRLKYSLVKESHVKITIHDLVGNEVSSLINENQIAGYHSLQWNATDNQGYKVSAGLYFYRIEAGDFVATKNMILMK